MGCFVFGDIVGAENCITDPAGLRVYECDGLTGTRVRPAAVVLPATTDEVARCVRRAREHGMPIVPRGSGTGLSGGALPVEGALVIGTARMRAILDVDRENQRMRVQPGVINLDISKHLAPLGYYYAPDPSSQSVCSIGGNVAENSGGAHCLKYGFTINHVVAVTMVLGLGRSGRDRQRDCRPARIRSHQRRHRQRGIAGYRDRGRRALLAQAGEDAHGLRDVSLDRRSGRSRLADHLPPASFRPRSR